MNICHIDLSKWFINIIMIINHNMDHQNQHYQNLFQMLIMEQRQNYQLLHQ